MLCVSQLSIEARHFIITIFGHTDLPSKGSRDPDHPTGDWPDRHFLLQGVTSRRQLCSCPAAPFSTARPLPRFCWLSHLQGLRSAGAEATWGQSQGSWCSGLHHSAKLCCSQQRPASNNSRDDSRRGHNQIAYLKSDYVLCPQRWRSSIQWAKIRAGADCGWDHDSFWPNSGLN